MEKNAKRSRKNRGKRRRGDSPALVLLLTLPIGLFLLLFMIVYTPIDFLRYRFSRFYRDRKRLYGKADRYTWLVTLFPYYGIYARIAKSGLPVRFLRDQRGPLSPAFFFDEGTRTLFEWEPAPHYDFEAQAWYLLFGKEEGDLRAYCESRVGLFHKCTAGDTESDLCRRVVFLVHEKDLWKEERNLAENADFLLVYNRKNFAEKLGALLSE